MLIPTQYRVKFVVVELSSNLTGRTLIANNSIKTLTDQTTVYWKKTDFFDVVFKCWTWLLFMSFWYTS